MELPMPGPTNPPRPLVEYKILSFDVYGSLVEYKAHILASLQPLLSRLSSPSPYLDSTPASTTVPDSASVGSIEVLKLFQKQEDKIKLEKPVKRFDEILSEIWRRLAKELNVETNEEEAKAFGSEANIASWPCFSGTIDALKSLGKHYHLVALSNIDNFAWDITSSSSVSRLGEVDWWKVFTSADYGEDATRADELKLVTLIDYSVKQGFEKADILHVAQSLGHDQAPAMRLGLSSVWLIGDGPTWGKQSESKMVLDKRLVGYAWKCRNLKEFAEIVDQALQK